MGHELRVGAARGQVAEHFRDLGVSLTMVRIFDLADINLVNERTSEHDDDAINGDVRIILDWQDPDAVFFRAVCKAPAYTGNAEWSQL